MNDNINGNKMLNHIDRIAGQRMPITADIFLTNFCNNRCPYCTYRRWELDSGAAWMKFSDFKKYALRMKKLGVKGFILTGGGEPTINRDFDKITAWLEQNNLHYGINTNFNKLVLCSPDYLKVSLDGWDEDSYEQCRGVRAYSTVIDNIFIYDTWRKENGSKTTLGVQKVITSSKEILPFYEGNKHLPFDYMSLRPVESTGGSFYLQEDALKDAKDCIKIISELRQRDSRVVLHYKWQELGHRFDRCTAHWAQIALNEKGEVMYCCHKPYQIIGHISDPDIMQKYEKAQTDICRCDVPCRLTSPNAFMERVEAGTKDPDFI